MTWQDLEAVKARAATSMDRAEYFATARLALAEAVTEQDQELRRVVHAGMPTSSASALQALARSLPDLQRTMTDHGELMRRQCTIDKRQLALTDVIAEQEMRVSGCAASTAARASAEVAEASGELRG